MAFGRQDYVDFKHLKKELLLCACLHNRDRRSALLMASVASQLDPILKSRWLLRHA